VSFADIAQNPLLARAARAELGTGGPDPPAAAGGAAAKAPQPEAEVLPVASKAARAQLTSACLSDDCPCSPLHRLHVTATLARRVAPSTRETRTSAHDTRTQDVRLCCAPRGPREEG